jgi:eukaryotic-like serine/threonine-protein kinase
VSLPPGFSNVTPIGSGAVSIVRRAEWMTSGRVVALKSLREGFSAGTPLAKQLEQEARTLAKLSHPNIVLLIDVVKHEGTSHLVLEYVDGENLRDILERRSRLSEALACSIASEVLRGLAHLHSRGFVHRDLKPENILLGKEGLVKLCDFGIATSGSAQIERAEGFGTPAYLAPEVLLGDAASPESDLFALGVCLFEMIAGRRPFDTEATDRGVGLQGRLQARERTNMRLRDREAPLLRTLAPETSRSVERLVAKLLQKRPSERVPTASRALEELLRVSRLEGHGAAHVQIAHVFGGHSEEQHLRKRSVASFAIKMALAGSAFLVLGTSLGLTRDFPPRNLEEGRSVLPLVPKNGGLLRVVVSPWAEVWVDGVKVDTTPFARAIPLSSEKHAITLRHPGAPDEEREVRPSPGETVTLDVTMQIDPGDGGKPDAYGLDAAAPLTRDPEVPRGKIRR